MWPPGRGPRYVQEGVRIVRRAAAKLLVEGDAETSARSLCMESIRR